MPNPSTLSRVFLGVLLTVAIVLIIVVASSRPTDTNQTTPLLTAKGTGTGTAPDGEPAKTVSEPSSEDDGEDARDTSAGTDTESARVTLDSTPPTTKQAADDSSTSQARVAKPGTVDANRPDTTTSDSESMAVAKPAAGGADPASPDVVPAKSEVPANDSPLEIARKSITGWDPLDRLSREFARRAAVRGSERAKPTPVAPPAHEIFPPTVVMSDAHRKSCLVFVGDAMPDATLKDVAGAEQSVRQSLGKRLTVVVFWNTENPYALDQFEEMPNELAPFSELGVQAIAVHVGPVPVNYPELVEKYGRDILCLADSDQAFYQQVATGQVPRTLLLAADGKVIWLDIEYSRTTRYDLRNALHYSLQNGQAAEGTEAD